MQLNLLRHAFYKLGNSTEESCRNCDWFDDNIEPLARALKLAELIANCKDDIKIKYVKSLNL